MKFIIAFVLLSVVLVNARSQEKDSSLCGNGQNQSPIDIHRNITTCLRAGESYALAHRLHLRFYEAPNATVSNTNGRLTFTGDFGYLTVGACSPCDASPHNFVSASIVSPAEHTLHGKRYPFEIQITTQKQGSNGTNDLVILSVFAYQQAFGGFNNRLLESLGTFPAAGATSVSPGPVNLWKLREAFHHEYYTYKGSLTSNGCPETVKWFVFKNPVGFDVGQVTALTSAIGVNATPAAAQPLHSRHLYWYRKHQY